jgi:hypothetical protein
MSGSTAEVSPEIRRMILRRDLVSFVYAAFVELHPGQQLEMAAHIAVIATALEKVRRGEIKRLIINLPPRSLKSHSVSVAFVGWMLGHDPGKHVICASYGQDLANDLATLCRRLIRSPLYRGLSATFSGSGKRSTISRRSRAGAAWRPRWVARDRPRRRFDHRRRSAKGRRCALGSKPQGNAYLV